MSRHLDTRLRVRLAVRAFPPSAASRSSVHCEPSTSPHLIQRGIFHHVSCRHPYLVVLACTGRSGDMLEHYSYELARLWCRPFDDKEGAGIGDLFSAVQGIEGPPCQNAHNHNGILKRSSLKDMRHRRVFYHHYSRTRVDTQHPANVVRQLSEKFWIAHACRYLRAVSGPSANQPDELAKLFRDSRRTRCGDNLGVRRTRAS